MLFFRTCLISPAVVPELQPKNYEVISRETDFDEAIQLKLSYDTIKAVWPAALMFLKKDKIYKHSTIHSLLAF